MIADGGFDSKNLKKIAIQKE